MKTMKTIVIFWFI